MNALRTFVDYAPCAAAARNRRLKPQFLCEKSVGNRAMQRQLDIRQVSANDLTISHGQRFRIDFSTLLLAFGFTSSGEVC